MKTVLEKERNGWRKKESRRERYGETYRERERWKEEGKAI